MVKKVVPGTLIVHGAVNSRSVNVIEQPWGDDRLKMNGAFIGCATKENADEIMALQSDNRKLRYLLAIQHDGPKHMIYGDDGELQCSACWIDFRRDTVADIERKLYEAGMRELERMVAAGDWPLPSVQGI